MGDAFGAVVEGWGPKTIEGRYGLITGPLNGRYTDDTEMMTGIMEAILEDPDFSQQTLAEIFAENFDRTRGYGGRISGVMKRIRKKVPASRVGTDSWGNGAAMRVAPIGFFYYDDPEKLKEMAIRSAEITHKHPDGVAGAIAQAMAVGIAAKSALEGKKLNTDSFVDEIAESVEEVSPGFVTEIKKLMGIKPSSIDKSLKFLVSNFTRNVSAIGAVPAALGAFLLSEKFEDAIIIAVNAGGDTDTTGAMAGAIAGAYWGGSAIPGKWLDKMEDGKKGMSYIRDTAKRLSELKDV